MQECLLWTFTKSSARWPVRIRAGSAPKICCKQLHAYPRRKLRGCFSTNTKIPDPDRAGNSAVRKVSSLLNAEAGHELGGQGGAEQANGAGFVGDFSPDNTAVQMLHRYNAQFVLEGVHGGQRRV